MPTGEYSFSSNNVGTKSTTKKKSSGSFAGLGTSPSGLGQLGLGWAFEPIPMKEVEGTKGTGQGQSANRRKQRQKRATFFQETGPTGVYGRAGSGGGQTQAGASFGSGARGGRSFFA